MKKILSVLVVLFSIGVIIVLLINAAKSLDKQEEARPRKDFQIKLIKILKIESMVQTNKFEFDELGDTLRENSFYLLNIRNNGSLSIIPVHPLAGKNFYGKPFIMMEDYLSGVLPDTGKFVRMPGNPVIIAETYVVPEMKIEPLFIQ
jgi:hypothetical protein